MADRNADGTFAKGHTKTGGRAPREREERYKEVMLTSVSFVDWERIVQKARDQALKGDAVARKWLSDYLIGPPVQRQEHTGADGGAITLKWLDYDPDDKPTTSA
jgi:hypothetical protein